MWQRDVKYIINRWNVTGGENRGKDRVKTVVDMKLWVASNSLLASKPCRMRDCGKRLELGTDIFEDVANSFFGETSISLRARFIISLLGMLLHYVELNVLRHIFFFFLLMSRFIREKYNLYFFSFQSYYSRSLLLILII